MIIKLLDSSDLKPGLTVPGRQELHVWIFQAEEIDNLHKYAHICLRQLLSQYTGIPKETLEFGTGEHGKPYLISNSFTSHLDTFSSVSDIHEIQFNLSHAGSCAAFIFSTGTPVGIDIEQLNRRVNMDAVSSKIFLTEEARHIKSLTGDDKRLAFFRLWTRTESFLKGIGTGLSVSFTDIKIQEEYSSWTSQFICAPDGYICCVSYRNF